MANRILNAAWTARCETPAQKLVLLRLADMANDKGTCWPSVPGLANDTGLDVRTVQRAIRGNIAQGHITVTSGGAKATNTYEIHPRHNATSESDTEPSNPRHNATHDPRQDATTPGGVLPGHPRHNAANPRRIAGRGVALDTQTPGVMPPEPQLTHSTTPMNPQYNQSAGAPGGGKLPGVDRPLALTIPLALNTPEFVKVWEEWTAYRKALRGVKNWAKLFQDQLDHELAGLAPDQAIACIQKSMRCGWKGLFPEKHRNEKRRTGEAKEIKEDIDVPTFRYE